MNRNSIFKLNLCSEELMTNISNHSTGRITHHSFDIYAYVEDGTAYVTLKDAGRPFNPLMTGKMADSHI
ncbi:MAG: ATP-binding protein [Prevotella sp.]|nr:ATP-binding protein [Prevotella sp.]